jgi:hypothetical protein
MEHEGAMDGIRASRTWHLLAAHLTPERTGYSSLIRALAEPDLTTVLFSAPIGRPAEHCGV